MVETVGIIVLATANFASDGWGRKWQTEASHFGHLNTNVKYYEAEDGYFFSHIVTGEGMWVHQYSPDTKNAIHWRETLKLSCKWEVWRKKNECVKDDSNIMGYSRDHSRWFYAASYDGDCSRYKVLLQCLNPTTVRSSLCLRVLLLHSKAKCVMFTPPLTCCTPGLRSWSPYIL